jgi:lysophospholipase L1-like esterase
MRPGKRLLTCLLAPLAGLLLAEGLVRALDRRPAPLPEVRGDVLVRVDDPIQLFENGRSRTKVLLYREAPGAPPRRVVMRTNAQRLRGPMVSKEKPEGTLRIACLGDSHTFGEGVGEGESWPDALREHIDPGHTIEVLNCGVNAYDTLQEVLWFERRILPLEPDLVVLAYFVNDVAARGLPGAGRDPLRELVHPRQTGWIASLRHTSRAADLICDAIYRHRERGAFVDSLWERYADDSPGWLRVQEALERLQRRCEAEGIRLLVAPYPYVEVHEGQFRSARALARVADHCAATGLQYLELTAAMLEGWDGRDLTCSPQDYHAGPAAHSLYAAALAGRLRELGYPLLEEPVRPAQDEPR